MHRRPKFAKTIDEGLAAFAEASNGYERAVVLLAQLPPEPSPQGAYHRWPEAPADALRQAVRPALPTLDALRETFNLDDL